MDPNKPVPTVSALPRRCGKQKRVFVTTRTDVGVGDEDGVHSECPPAGIKELPCTYIEEVHALPYCKKGYQVILFTGVPSI